MHFDDLCTQLAQGPENWLWVIFSAALSKSKIFGFISTTQIYLLITEKVEILAKYNKEKGEKHTNLLPGDNHLSTFSIISFQSFIFYAYILELN